MYCRHCGTEIADGSLFCSNCGKEQTVKDTPNNTQPLPTVQYSPPPYTAPKKKKGCLTAIICVLAVIVLVGVMAAIGSNRLEDELDKAQKETSSQSEKTGETTTSIASFKDLCAPLDYKAIARNPSDYEGQHVKFRGKVIQVSESSNLFSDDKNLTLRIDSKEDEDGFWDETVYVEFVLSPNDSRILEEDIVTVYGICTGVTSYTTVLGSTITIPSIDANYIEVAAD